MPNLSHRTITLMLPLVITLLFINISLAGTESSSKQLVKQLIDRDPEYQAWASRYQPKRPGTDMVNFEQVQDGVTLDNAPITRVWLEFKPGTENDPVPVYRYVIKPVKNITAEEIIERQAGMFMDQHADFPVGQWLPDYPVWPRKAFPAKVPDKVTEGAIITDWHYCADCFEARHSSEAMRTQILQWMREGRSDKIEDALNVERIRFGSEAAYTQAMVESYQKNDPSITLESLQERWGAISVTLGVVTGTQTIEKERTILACRLAALEKTGEDRQATPETVPSEKQRAVKQLIDSDPGYQAWEARYQPKSAGNDLVNFEQVQDGVSLENAPIVRVWLEFKPGTEYDAVPPVYRYVIKPVKNITAQEIIQRQAGMFMDQHARFPVAPWSPDIPYFYMKSFPAKVPDTVTDGAVITDWQYCPDCFYGTHSSQPMRTKHIQWMRKKRCDLVDNARNVELIKFGSEAAYVQAKVDTYQKDDPSVTVTLESLKERWGDFSMSLGVITGEQEIQKEQAILKRRIVSVQNAGAAHAAFLEDEYYPLSFDGWATSQGCLQETKGDTYDRMPNPNEVIDHNIRYLECRSKALETFDLASYQQAYTALNQKEEQLLDEAGLVYDYVRKPAKTVITPEKMMDQAISDIEYAAEMIDEAQYQIDSDAERRAERQKRKAEHEAWSRAHWANTLNSIQQSNQIIADRLNATDRMIAQTRAMNNYSSGTTYSDSSNARRSVDKARQNVAKAKSRAQQASESAAQARQKALSQPAKVASTQSDTSASSTAQQAKPEPEKQPNRMIGSGRDYEMYGTTEVYHPYDTAVDLAKTNLRNKAAKFCNSSYKADITWGETNCKKSEHADTYQCSVGGLINCWEQRCDSEFCGTRN
jgi:hypothetical protein